MILSNLSIAGAGGAVDIRVSVEKIAAVDDAADAEAEAAANALDAEAAEGLTTPTNELCLSLSGAIVFPGLVNSHDHLDFNLFPSLGNRIYPNYRAWGPDIHKQNRAEIAAVLKIPQALRIRWGVYKNLLNGVTTVVNHGEHLSIDAAHALIGIYQEGYSLHSPAFEKNWRWKLNQPFTGSRPYVIHVGEGTDETAALEIDSLIRWNLFKKPIIGIHGVAMNERQAAGFKAVVWCPVSNYFLLDRTAPVDRLKKRVPILFGTDSTLTAGWNIWEHLRLARKLGMLGDRELLDTLTTTAASAWGLKETGSLAPGQYADMVIARPSVVSETVASGDTGTMDAFYSLNPENILLILYHGHIRLFDASLLDLLTRKGFSATNFHAVTVNNSRKYVEGDLPGLIGEIKSYGQGLGQSTMAMTTMTV
jgi:cytosine/adenosine deaminase-related metal-dependent hydrolase